jgi:hypothetical protein
MLLSSSYSRNACSAGLGSVLSGGERMDCRGVGYSVRHPKYPDGVGVLIAWDYAATSCSELSTYLLRGERGYFVHYHIVDRDCGDSVLALDASDAAYLYQRLRVRIMPGQDAFD